MNEQTFNELVQFDNLVKLGDGLYQMPIAILRDSEVFDGHFPDQPVLPGVVMIAIISRATELALEMDLKLESAND